LSFQADTQVTGFRMRASYGWPITLAVVMIVLVVTLIVGWITLTVREIDQSALFWVLLLVGTLFLLLVLVGVVLYLLISIKGIRLNQRQSNFIDSVTHELKSPIASLKLYLQTLARRSVSEEKQADFFRFMLDDVARLDALINHMLDAARLDQEPVEADLVDVELSALLHNCAETVCLRYHLSTDTVRLSTTPAMLRARQIDLEMVFRNLIDNAVKYGGSPPQVDVESRFVDRDTITTRIVDNGSGIPPKLRRKVFGRFVRLGSELERSQTGTGIGLFIVRTLVNRLHGNITVRDRGQQSGTVFEVQLPGRPADTRAPSESPPPAVQSALG
jgi:two-component system, OmpR family, phosphate regulon sensor histidine kinase PhoR